MQGARPLIEQALKDDPKLGIAHENMGFLDFSDGKDSEAASEFTQAYALDGTLYLSLFAKTMLSPVAASNAAADQAALHELLTKVTDLNPKFAPAYIQLARLWIGENVPKVALSFSRKAEELEPSRAGYHILTGYILLRLGKQDEAREFAKFVADRWFGPDHDEAVELWNSIATQQRSFQTLSETIPKNTETLSGTLKSVACREQDQVSVFYVDKHGKTLTFHGKGLFFSGFSDTIWYGEDHFSLCHHLEGMRVVIRYRAPADFTYSGDIAEIEIRDNVTELLQGTTNEGTSLAKP